MNFTPPSLKKNRFKTALESSNLEMVGYEKMAIVFVDSVNGFVKLNDGCWINGEDGGNCYFNIKINLNTKNYYDLDINRSI
ncbi:hypothetical protein SAMN04488007_3648 [Maribacter aquivivus]|uniref:Uncharacterized protein n=1 Tax=Maribacter aquivivus TaxID=228958 RepID=A0A1M6UHL0_9FLAO|nr:hypothetical protein SAMN04488007_3648 [Maribacter aquivivus]